MCVRMCPLTAEEAQAVLDARATPGAHAIRYIERPDPALDARPGTLVPVYIPKDGGLAVARLTWGFELDGKPNAVFNTRIESALEQLRPGGRCLYGFVNPSRRFRHAAARPAGGRFSRWS